MRYRIGLGSIAAALCMGFPVAADDADVCQALQPMFEGAAETLAAWQAAGQSDRRSIMRLNSKVTLAHAFAGDNGWPEDVVVALHSMRTIALDAAEPPLSAEEIPEFVLTQAQLVKEAAAEKCPNANFAALPID